MAITNMKAIRTISLSGGSAASIVFDNIPQTYTDLVVRLSLRTEGGNRTGLLTVNGDSTDANYMHQDLYGSGTTTSNVTSNGGNRYAYWVDWSGDTAGVFGVTEIYIPNYAGAQAKIMSIESVEENNGVAAYSEFATFLWNNTNAINELAFTAFSGNWAQHSSATLYGVTSVAPNAKATGGVVSYDSNYFYHTFPFSGTFTPTQSITADYLVVAGGGGGGKGAAGGGGAGGYRTFASQSLSATPYTVTVGGGGAGSTSVSSRGAKGNNSVFGSNTATGGGGGGSETTAIFSGQAGGSGGGSRSNTNTSGGAGNEGGYTPVEGYAGGTTTGSSGSGGGGGSGGAGQVGASTNNGGYGGIATANDISGSTVYYAGGGGGGTNAVSSETRGLGGGTATTSQKGGGGDGALSSSAGTNATANTGGGGGGGDGTVTNNGTNGGSGIVIVRYAR